MQDLDLKIEQWKKRLLDLGKRNRLINFKETKRSSVAIILPSYDILYKKLVHDECKLKFPFPLKATYDENGEEININFQEGDLETKNTLNEQQKTLKALRGSAKTSIQERGINSLFLTFGIIRWKESVTSDVVISSPLVLVPVVISVESITDPYVLQLHDDEIVVNPSLAFKFENDFGIILPEFDGHEDDITEYLIKIKEIAKKKDWDVGTDVNLTLLSFLKINMYKDLNTNKDKIVSNPIIKALSGDKSEIRLVPNELNNFDHDKNTRPIDTYQVVDADSSQQDAILLSKKGISFALQGPPGTGKSQTITNIIAEGLSDGKKVLFVSEKMAALEVVKKRLTDVGLDDFCLTLHSYKANKKEVIKQLAKTLSIEKISMSEDAVYKLSLLEEKRDKLNEYQDQLHEKCPPLDISIYQANGRLAKLSTTQDIIFGIKNIGDTDSELINKYRYLLSEFSKTIGKLSEGYSENPWYGCNVPVVTHELRHDIEVNLSRLKLKLKELNESYECIIEKTGMNIDITVNNILVLTDLLDFSSKSPIFPIKWLSGDIDVLISDAQEYFKLFVEYKVNTANLLNRYVDNILKLNANDIIMNIESKMTDVKEYLNDENFISNKDIVLKADFIITESAEIKSFIQGINEQSIAITSILGIEEQKSISSLFEIKGLIELIIKEPQPVKKWFDYGQIQHLDELLEVAKEEQLVLYDRLKKIKVNYDESILNIDYDGMIAKFENYYAHLLKIISDLNNTDNSLKLNKYEIYSFANDQAKKIRQFNLIITNAVEVSEELADKIGIKSTPTLRGLVSLSELISVVIQNTKPTLAWFDGNKDHIIDKVISETKNVHKEIEKETKELLTNYNKDILSIDYKNMTIRFKNQYTSFLKFLKGSYSADKKILRGFSKEPLNKLSDIDIIGLLNKISLIKEKEQWLIDNKSLANEMLGGLYVDNYTDWELVDKSRANYDSIKKYFGMNKIPEQLKEIMIDNKSEKLITQHSILSKLTKSSVVEFIESIFGVIASKQPISELLNEMNDIAKTSLEIKNDCQSILNYSINNDMTDKATINDFIDLFKSIKIVSEKRKWFSENNMALSENYGEYYDGEDTDWNNVKDHIDIVEQIIAFFGKKQIANKLIDYLISFEDTQGIFTKFNDDIDDIKNKEMVMRLDNLLKIDDNQNVDFNNLVSRLEAIGNGVRVAYTNYHDFSCCSKGAMQFENIMTDIILLSRIQEIEAIVENHSAELQVKFDFEFKGIGTEWEKVISSLEYANKFKSLSNEYELSKNYINDVCYEKSLSQWTIKYSEKLKNQDANLKSDFAWFADLFDNGERLYCTSIYELLSRIEKSINNLYLLEEWIDFRSIRQQCRGIGLSEFVEKVEQIGMPHQIIVDTFFKRFYRLWLDAMMPLYPAVNTFRSHSHELIINEFKELDKLQFKIARLRILERLINRLPNTNIATSSVDEVGILKREITKQRKIMPLRRLFKEIPTLLTALKPCLMMSPLSVSLFLQADGYNFDTVIFDEASQVCTEDAIGAIMRGKQVIIAGDSKQLPPTSFLQQLLMMVIMMLITMKNLMILVHMIQYLKKLLTQYQKEL